MQFKTKILFQFFFSLLQDCSPKHHAYPHGANCVKHSALHNMSVVPYNEMKQVSKAQDS